MTVVRDYLLKHGAITGPLTKNTSYSHLGNLKTLLFGFPLFQGGEYFLWFGTALHELFLENKRGEAYQLLTKPDQNKIEIMVMKLNAHPVVQKLFKDSIREEKIYKKCKDLSGIEFAYILDMDQPFANTGSDLKSTASKTFDDCCKKFVAFGYVAQGVLYKKLTGRKKFFFIFISKHAPHDIFILNTADFKREEKYAWNELRFLSYFYKNYGNVITEFSPTHLTKTEVENQKLKQSCQPKQESKVSKKSVRLTKSSLKPASRAKKR